MEQIERLSVGVKRERRNVIATVIEGASSLQAVARSAPESHGGAMVELDRAVLDEAVAELDASSEPFLAAIRLEEMSLRAGRVDPWRDAVRSLEDFAWLCWALADFPSRRGPDAASRQIVAEFLIEACRIAIEVGYLLREGFYGGAAARWRSIYELVVFGELISRHGDEAAVRFRMHDAQQRKRMADRLRLYGPAWDMTQLTLEQSAEIERSLADARSAYGDEFDESDYGWAADFVRSRGSDANNGGGDISGSPKHRTRRIRFSDLEDAVGAARWRAHTIVASAFVHSRLPSGPVAPGSDSLNLRLALVEPGDGHVGALTALSLSSLTQCLIELSADPTDDADQLRASLALAIVEQVRQRVDRAFTAVEDSLMTGG
jgi:hypothetical protein